MSAEAISFKSNPLPDELNEFRQSLEAAHDDGLFSATEPRQTTRQIQDIAAESGLELGLTRYRGLLDLPGASIEHLWLECQGHVIDLTYPVNHPEFIKHSRNIIIGDFALNGYVEFARETSFLHLVWGKFPNRVKYIGKPVYNWHN